MLSVAVVLPLMGERIDRLGAGAALQFVAGLAVVLVASLADCFSISARGEATSRSRWRPRRPGHVPTTGRGSPDVLHSEITATPAVQANPRTKPRFALDFVGSLHVTADGAAFRIARRHSIGVYACTTYMLLHA